MVVNTPVLGSNCNHSFKGALARLPKRRNKPGSLFRVAAYAIASPSGSVKVLGAILKYHANPRGNTNVEFTKTGAVNGRTVGMSVPTAVLSCESRLTETTGGLFVNAMKNCAVAVSPMRDVAVTTIGVLCA